MFRTADGAGINKLYLAGITPEPVDRWGVVRSDIAKVSLGAEATVPWEKVKSCTALIKKLKKDGYTIYAIEQSKNSVPLDCLRTKDWGLKMCFIVGNEVRGLPKNILKLVDRIIEIPMYGNKESLNVSVAFGIIAYFLRCEK